MERRNGKMRRRSDNIPRHTELGFYVIYTDTRETEKNYFNGLKALLPEDIRNRITVRILRAKTCDLVSKAVDEANKDSQYRDIWIVLDRDMVTNFDQIISEAKSYGINAGWSNPCIEAWFYAYFGSMPNYDGSVMYCDKFKEKFGRVTGAAYEKSDKDIYEKLSKNGDEKRAIEIARAKLKEHISNGKKDPSDMCPCSTVSELVAEIKRYT